MAPVPAAARLAEAASDPTVLHVWLPAGHTLCELEEGDYLLNHVAELAAVEPAVCGPCLLIVSRVRRQASALLEVAAGRVAPEIPSEAWRLLRKSGWGSRLNIDAFIHATPDLDARTRFDAVRDAVDPESVSDLADEMLAARSAARTPR